MKRGLAGLLLATTLGCATVQDSIAKSTVHPLDDGHQRSAILLQEPSPLTASELNLLQSFEGDAQKLQRWIDSSMVYTRDEEQFYPVLCDKKDECDYWAPVAHVLRSQKEDCDGIIGLAHYVLGKKGFGLYLSNDAVTTGSAHIVYVYESSGKYGVISINSNEYAAPQFTTLDQVALHIDKKFHGKYNYYQKVMLPQSDQVLMYSLDGLEAHSSYQSPYNYFKKSD